jgi:hypothetical protein
MKKTNLFLFLCSFFLFNFSLAWAFPPESNLTYKGNVFSYFINRPITEPNNLIEEAVIVVHGSERNADTYYNSVSLMAEKVGKGATSIVISPHFKLATDKLLPNEFTWTDEGWLRGDASLVQSQVFSFEIMDHFIDLLVAQGNFPNLKNIVITGHSAGGQLAQRFALGTQLDKKYNNIHFRFLVVNPGSYVYLTPSRPQEIPHNNTCAYNDYKYGLDHLNAYMSQGPTDHMVESYLEKDVIYFLGEKDIISDDIDQDCPARFQGINRLQRGKGFKMILDKEFPHNKHHLFTNPGVAHTEWGMYTSEIGKKLLFTFEK